MILTEIVYSNTGNAIKHWSDRDVYIMNQYGEKFDIAYDWLELSGKFQYVETDEPIEDDQESIDIA